MDKILDLSIIIVNYNGKGFIEKCLESIFRFLDAVQINSGTAGAKKLLWEVIVVDNASYDGSAELAEKFVAGGNVRLIRQSMNLGFAAASNAGADSSEGRYLLFLNPDTEFIGKGLEGLINFYENKIKSMKVGMVGSRILNSDGSLQLSSRAFPTLARQFYESYFLHRAFPKSRIFGSYFMTWWDHTDTRKVDWLSGAFLLCRREVFFHVGGFDRDYFMYSEDADICLKLTRNGYASYYYPGFGIKHSDAGIASENSALRNLQIWKSRIIYFKKNYSPAHAKVFSMLYFIFTVNRILLFYTISLLRPGCTVYKAKARGYGKSLCLFFQDNKKW